LFHHIFGNEVNMVTLLKIKFIRTEGFNTHMRLLRDEQPVKRRESFSFRIGAKGRDMMDIVQYIPNGDGPQEYMLYDDQYKPLFVPQRPLLAGTGFPPGGKPICV
jgi:hypothetical protein